MVATPDKNWFLPKITDYWDWRNDPIEKFGLKIMNSSPDEQSAQYNAIRQAVTEHVRVLPDRTLLDVLMVVVEDLYKSGNRATLGGSAFEMYLEASAGILFSSARTRQCIVHYLVDNIFEQTAFGMKRPLDFYEGWFRAAGLVYVCPQHIAAGLMRTDGKNVKQYFKLLPVYIAEAKDVAEMLVEKCHSESRHYVFINADSSLEPYAFEKSMGVAGSAGLVTVIRNEAPIADSKCQVIYPSTKNE